MRVLGTKNRTSQTNPIHTTPLNDLKEHMIDQSVWENQDGWSDSSGASLYSINQTGYRMCPMTEHFHGKMSLWTPPCKSLSALLPFFSSITNSNDACTHQSGQSCYPTPLIYIKSTLQLTQIYETLCLPHTGWPRQKGKVMSKPVRLWHEQFNTHAVLENKD